MHAISHRCGWTGLLGKMRAIGSVRAGPVLVVVLLGVSWLATYALGGSKTVGPQLFYVPIIMASAAFGGRGALVAAVSGGLAAGPLMPLDVEAGTPQDLGSWLLRLGLFVLVGRLTAFLMGHSTASVRSEAHRRRIRREIRAALAEGHLQVHYQPIMGLDSGRMVGVEALVRWFQPSRGPIPPDQFIPALEDAGDAGLVTRFVLEQSCEQVARWRASGALDGVETFELAVNVSATELGDAELEAVVRDVLTRSGLPARWLNIEVTETALIQDLDAAAAGLQRLRELGVRLAIDDFGAGQSSLTYLHHFPVDVIKLDRSFLDPLVGDRRGLLIARSVVGLAKSLGLATVAEGVETAEQLIALRGLGCDLAQGYLFHRPGPAGDVEVILRRASVPAARAPRAAAASTRTTPSQGPGAGAGSMAPALPAAGTTR